MRLNSRKNQKDKVSKVYLNVKGIPPKINEIIGYLSQEFSNGALLERDDIAQTCYLRYLSIIKKTPKAKKYNPGFWFIRFKWDLLRSWTKRKQTICRQWAVGRELNGQSPVKAGSSYSLYSNDDIEKLETKEQHCLRKKIKKLRKHKKYGFENV